MHHSVEVAGKLRFMCEVMGLIPNGLMSLEGKLGKCRIDDRLIVSRKPVGKLRRDTLWPRQQFLVIRLEPASLDHILQAVAAAGVELEDDGILHVYMEHNGAIEFGAHDWYSGCVVTGPAVPASLLARLQQEGVIDSFCPEPDLAL
jgi:hypothetical protein